MRRVWPETTTAAQPSSMATPEEKPSGYARLDIPGSVKLRALDGIAEDLIRALLKPKDRGRRRK